MVKHKRKMKTAGSIGFCSIGIGCSSIFLGVGFVFIVAVLATILSTFICGK